MKRRALLAAAAAAATGGCTGLEAPDLEQLTVAAGPPGSVYHRLGTALAEAAQAEWGLPIQVLHTTESVDNLRYVGEGDADIGFATVDACTLARHGDYPFESAQPVAALAGLYEDYLHIVVLADSDIKTVAGLAGQALATGPLNSGTDLISARVLRAAGLPDMKPKPLSIAEAREALTRRELAAIFCLGGVPMPEVAELAERTPIRVLSVPDELIELQDIYGWAYLPRTIQPGIYGLESEVQTIGIPNVLMVRDDMPEPTAYRLTELVFAARRRLALAHPQAGRIDERSGQVTYDVPRHPGAVRYYREAKPFV